MKTVAGIFVLLSLVLVLVAAFGPLDRQLQVVGWIGCFFGNLSIWARRLKGE